MIFARSLKRCGSIMFKRFQSQQTGGFNNKFNFNINPPPVHEYWNMRNNSVLLAFVPIYFIVGYFGSYTAGNIEGTQGLLDVADSNESPMKTFKFGEPQASST